MCELTEREVLALKAVAYGADTNRKLVAGSFCENIYELEKRKMIRFDEAIEVVYGIIKKIDMRKEDEGK